MEEIIIVDLREIKEEPKELIRGLVTKVEQQGGSFFLYLDTGYRIRLPDSVINEILTDEVLARMKGK